MCINQAHINRAEHLGMTDLSLVFNYRQPGTGLNCKPMQKLHTSAQKSANL